MSTEESKWWWSALSAAKEKSMLAINATRRDLVEFVSVLQNDTASAISSVGTNLKGLVQPGTEPARSVASLSAHSAVPLTGGACYDRYSARLYAMQSDPATYLSVPAGEEQSLAKWKETFDIQEHQTEISQLLVSASHVRMLHSQLVPAQISYELFWQHYWFNVTKIKQSGHQEEDKRAKLVARVAAKDEQWLWDDDTDNVPNTCHRPTNLNEQQRSESSESFVCVAEDGVNEQLDYSKQSFPLHPTDIHHLPSHPTDVHNPPTDAHHSLSHFTDVHPHSHLTDVHPPSHPIVAHLTSSPSHGVHLSSQEPDIDQECSPKHSQKSDSDWEQWDD